MSNGLESLAKMAELVESLVPSIGHVADGAERAVIVARDRGRDDGLPLVVEILNHVIGANESLWRAVSESLPRLIAARDELQRIEEGN